MIFDKAKALDSSLSIVLTLISLKQNEDKFSILSSWKKELPVCMDKLNDPLFSSMKIKPRL